MNKMNEKNIKTITLWPNGEIYPEFKSVWLDYLGIYVKNDDPFLIKDAITGRIIYTHKEVIHNLKLLLNKYCGNNKFKSENCYTLSGNLGNSLIVIDNNGSMLYCSPKIRFDENFKKDYKEDLKSGFFRQNINVSTFKKDLKITGVDINTKYDNFLKFIENKPLTYKGLYGKKYQFGIEIETISGLMPKYLAYELFYSSVHDGSLRQTDDNTAYGKLNKSINY